MTDQQRQQHSPASEPEIDADAEREGDAPGSNGRGRRQRRFAIPEGEDHARVAEKIEAFLQGPAVRPVGRPRRHRAASSAGVARVSGESPFAQPERLRSASMLDSRADWNAALRLEEARHQRYGRPIAIAVIDVVVMDPLGVPPSRPTMDTLAGALGQLLRVITRETDRVARFGPTRFNVLLPETSRAEARRFAERARNEAELGLVRGSLQATLRIALAAPSVDESLADALATAEAQLAS